MRAKKTDAQNGKSAPQSAIAVSLSADGIGDAENRLSTDTESEKTTWIALPHHVTTVEKPPAQSKHEGTDPVVRIGTWVRVAPPCPDRCDAVATRHRTATAHIAW